MRPDAEPAGSPATRPNAYLYAIVRVVPRVERGEGINVGVILLCRSRRFLGARTVLDEGRLRALDPAVDVGSIRPHLEAIEAIARGDRDAGPLAERTIAERFHWLVAPSSTMIQASQVHTGMTDDPASELEHLVATLVR
jgi:Protein of unknown function (DUF3037)